MTKLLEENQICGNCRFFKVSHYNDQRGECRRFPPQLWSDVQENETGLGVGFPDITTEDWCGEFQPSVDYSSIEDLLEKGFQIVDPPRNN